jgi:hypothetical protein
MKMKKIVLALFSIIAVLGMTAPATSAAVNRHQNVIVSVARSSPHDATIRSTASTTSCYYYLGYVENSWAFLHNDVGGFFKNDFDSPHTLHVDSNTTSNLTTYCQDPSEYNSSLYWEFVQYGYGPDSDRCLSVDTSNRTIVEGSCASKNAAWQVNTATFDGYVFDLFENEATLACIYQNGLGNPATYNPCQTDQTSDLWR